MTTINNAARTAAQCCAKAPGGEAPKSGGEKPSVLHAVVDLLKAALQVTQGGEQGGDQAGQTGSCGTASGGQNSAINGNDGGGGGSQSDGDSDSDGGGAGGASNACCPAMSTAPAAAAAPKADASGGENPLAQLLELLGKLMEAKGSGAQQPAAAQPAPAPAAPAECCAPQPEQAQPSNDNDDLAQLLELLSKLLSSKAAGGKPPAGAAQGPSQAGGMGDMAQLLELLAQLLGGGQQAEQAAPADCCPPAGGPAQADAGGGNEDLAQLLELLGKLLGAKSDGAQPSNGAGQGAPAAPAASPQGAQPQQAAQGGGANADLSQLLDLLSQMISNKQGGAQQPPAAGGGQAASPAPNQGGGAKGPGEAKGHHHHHHHHHAGGDKGVNAGKMNAMGNMLEKMGQIMQSGDAGGGKANMGLNANVNAGSAGNMGAMHKQMDQIKQSGDAGGGKANMGVNANVNAGSMGSMGAMHKQMDQIKQSGSPVGHYPTYAVKGLDKNKQTVNAALDKMNATPEEKARVMAMGMQESQGMNANERDTKKDGNGGAANASAFNMNHDFIQKMGGDPKRLNDPANLGEAAQMMLKGMRTMGTDNMMNMHRGGASGLKDGSSFGAADYRRGIDEMTKQIQADPALLTNDQRVARNTAYV